MRDYFIFGDVNSSDYGLIVTGVENTESAKRKTKRIVVPGRSGELIQEDGSYENATQKYRVSIVNDYEKNYPAWLNRAISLPAYQRLEDSIHPEEFRMAAFTGPTKPKTTGGNKSGSFVIEFDCQPQRWLKDGEIALRIASGTKLFNAWQPAKPLIHITGVGKGTLAVGSSTVDIEDIKGSMTIDSENQNVYAGAENRNNSVVVTGGFPVLKSGETMVNYSGGIETIEIIPRWWKL